MCKLLHNSKGRESKQSISIKESILQIIYFNYPSHETKWNKYIFYKINKFVLLSTLIFFIMKEKSSSSFCEDVKINLNSYESEFDAEVKKQILLT